MFHRAQLWGRVNPYPEPRERAVLGAEAGDLFGGEEEAIVPAPEIFSFTIRVGVGPVRRSISSGPFRGIGLVTHLRVEFSSTATVQNIGFEIGVGSSPVNEADVTLSTARPYREIFRRLDSPTTVVDQRHHGFANARAVTSALLPPVPLRIPIIDTEFHLVIAVTNTQAFSADVVGHVMLLHGLTRAMLAAALS